jgi:hypothetical protein
MNNRREHYLLYYFSKIILKFFRKLTHSIIIAIKFTQMIKFIKKGAFIKILLNLYFFSLLILVPKIIIF